MTFPTQERCDTCDDILVVWTYMAAEGDMMFHPKTEVPLVVVEGPGELQKRAALLCARCDRLDLVPRRDHP